jgi:hypothetical protein
MFRVERFSFSQTKPGGPEWLLTGWQDPGFDYSAPDFSGLI